MRRRLSSLVLRCAMVLVGFLALAGCASDEDVVARGIAEVERFRGHPALLPVESDRWTVTSYEQFPAVPDSDWVRWSFVDSPTRFEYRYELEPGVESDEARSTVRQFYESLGAEDSSVVALDCNPPSCFKLVVRLDDGYRITYEIRTRDIERYVSDEVGENGMPTGPKEQATLLTVTAKIWA